jgi:hypothetical protein
MTTLRFLLLATVLAATGACAQAAAVHFNFENTGTNPAPTDNLGHATLDFQQGGVSLRVTARASQGGAGWNVFDPVAGSGTGVYFGDSGLGAYIGGTDGNDLDGGNTATDRSEMLVFTFDRVVTLTAINFGRWDGRDNYIGGFDPYLGDLATLLVDGLGVLNYRGINDHASLSLTGREFAIRADDDNTSFRIQDLDIQTTVPEPATLALVAWALLALKGARRPGGRA